MRDKHCIRANHIKIQSLGKFGLEKKNKLLPCRWTHFMMGNHPFSGCPVDHEAACVRSSGGRRTAIRRAWVGYCTVVS